MVYQIACTRLHLKRREKIIFYRLLGFLIRNDKPFPYSRKSLSELTGYSKSSIDESLNVLETLRLVDRIGCTNRVRFLKGSILKRICTLARKRINIILSNDCTLAQEMGKLRQTSPETGYRKTYSSLKRKEMTFCFNPKYHEYVNQIKSDINLGLLDESVHVLSYAEWMDMHDK